MQISSIFCCLLKAMLNRPVLKSSWVITRLTLKYDRLLRLGTGTGTLTIILTSMSTYMNVSTYND